MIQKKARDLDEQVARAFIKSCSRRYEQWKKNDLSVALQTLPKQFKKKNVFKCGSFLLIALMFLGILNSISKTYATSVRTQMCIIIDGSGSITETKWAMIKNGMGEAINSTIPKDGSVELTIVQFGYSPSNGCAKTELTPTVVDVGNCAAIIDIVLAMPKSNQSTPMAHGIFLGWTELRNSPNFAFSEEQVINLATDGAANIRNNNATSDLDGSGGGSPDARDDVIAVVNYAVSQGLDELDVEGIGIVSTNRDWLKNWVVRPQPAHLAPPFNPGWIRVVTNSSEFAETLGEKFNAIDRSITEVEPSKTVVCQGHSLNINVTVINYGNETETFNLTAYANATVVGKQEITLTNGDSETLPFTWNTTGFAKGNYTISAYVASVPGEIDQADNGYIDGTVIVVMVGDLNADGKVNILDIFLAARAFGSKPGNTRWDSNADVNEDGTVNILDIFIVAKEFGKTDP